MEDDDPYGFPEHTPSFTEHTPPAGPNAQADGNTGTEQTSGWPAEHAGDGEPQGSASIAEKREELLHARDMMIRQLDEVVRCVR